MTLFGQLAKFNRILCLIAYGFLAAVAFAGIECRPANADDLKGPPPVQDDGTSQGNRDGFAKVSDALPDKRDEIIRDLLRRVEQLEMTIRSLSGIPESKVPPTPVPPAAPSTTNEEEERIARAALERTLIERSGILLPPGTLEIEPSLTFAHASSDNISIDGVSIESTLVIGEILTDKVRRNLLIPALTFRLGLPADFQLETKIPYRYEAERTLRGDNSERASDISGLGDVEVALSHQFVKEKGWVPDILGSLRWKSDTGRSPSTLEGGQLATGTGYHALQYMATALKVKEPAAFFGSLFYTTNFPVSKVEGRVYPGDAWGLNLGMAMALNLDTSINFVWEQRFINRSKLNGEKIPGSALYPANFRVGTTYVFTPDLTLDFSVVIGLNRDAPDVQAIIALPFRYPGLFAMGSP